MGGFFFSQLRFSVAQPVGALVYSNQSLLTLLVSWMSKKIIFFGRKFETFYIKSGFLVFPALSVVLRLLTPDRP